MNYNDLYNKITFSKYSKEEQKNVFNMLNSTFEKDKNSIEDKLNMFYAEAQKNNIAVIDFLSNIYLDGKVVDANLYFSTCLALYAGANGSKLSLDRVRELLTSTLNNIVNSIKKEKLFNSFNLNENNYEDFLLNHICSCLVAYTNLTLDKILSMRTHLSDYDDFMVLDLEDACQDDMNKMIEMLGDVK